MKTIITASFLGLTLFSSATVLADVLVLKDGQSLTGTLVSRNADKLVFEIAGQQLSFDTDKVQSISFDDIAPAVKQDKIQMTKDKSTVVISKVGGVAPIGTRIVVRTNTAINSKKHKAGHKFTVRLEADLVSNDVVIASRGSTVYGVITQAKQSGRLLGKTSLMLTMTDIMLNNQMKPIQTSAIKALTEGTGKSTVSRTARLAAIGGLANGSDGAKNMAKVGVGVSLLTSGNSINIPAGTLLEFQLTQPLSTVK
ncbi:MAG: hypothetical protein HRT55_16870 [Colwellia sp.]|uniref:hypothetical protein n=1 Tax=Colwellia sp. TaxID=56799 RepID=UPI0025B7D33C|nr:hypothetical protein [Colwellia sp.]NQZ27979.1 hypothetical protein [Colwellia sp.]